MGRNANHASPPGGDGRPDLGVSVTADVMSIGRIYSRRTALLNSCDRHTVAGMRDFAILALLARLGLRAGEVAALTLEDIDWHHGEMVVRGKGGRQERLPLPAGVGEAVVTYLRHRPGFACRASFLKVRAPVTGLSSEGSKTWSAGVPARRAGHTIRPGPQRLASLDDLYSLATAERNHRRFRDQDGMLIICKPFTPRH